MSRDESPLDPARMAGLASARTSGGETLLSRMVAAYIEASPALLEEIARARAKGDPRPALRAVHEIGGSCRYFGADRLHCLCAEAERLGRAGEREGFWKLVPDIQEEYAKVESALKSASSGGA